MRTCKSVHKIDMAIAFENDTLHIFKVSACFGSGLSYVIEKK